MESTLSQDQYRAYLAKNDTWNFVVNTLDLTFYTFATSFIFGSTVLSLYASYLTSSAVLIGLIPAIQSVGYFLPQLLVSRKSEQLSRKKPFVQVVSVMERVPYAFVALGIAFWGGAPRWVAYAILALSVGMATGAGGLAGPAWNAMLAKVIRPERRGRMFGLSHAVGALLGIGGAAISRYVLGTYAYPTSFGICFGLCFIFQIMSWICLSLNREPARKPVNKDVSVGDYWRRLPIILRENPNFAKYLVSRAFIILGAMGTSFYIVYGRVAFQMDDAFAANLTMASMLSQATALLLLGWLADRRGYKLLMELSTMCALVSVALVLLAPGEVWLYAVFMLMGIYTSGMMVAGFGIVMEFCETDEVPTFSALAGTLLGVPILLAPLLGGWIIDRAGFRALFVTSLIVASVGWAIMRWGVREPRHEAKGPAPSET